MITPAYRWRNQPSERWNDQQDHTARKWQTWKSIVDKRMIYLQPGFWPPILPAAFWHSSASVLLGATPKCETWTLSTSCLHGIEDGWAKRKCLTILRAQIFGIDTCLPLGPSSKLALTMCMALSGNFSSMEKKNMFQVMLFSMLHYSISQSNNSLFVHPRILSCLIVYGFLLPRPIFAVASTSPFAAFL